MTTQASAGALDEARGTGGSPGSGRRSRVVLSCCIVLAAYALLSMFNDSAATLGTDEGGKVATLKVMSERGSFSPDVGYWAAAWDPAGDYHGLYYTVPFGEKYVNVTSLPMILLARPLWTLGGYRATLLLPMVGGVLAALAARALARRLAPEKSRARAGDVAFWVVALASPVTVYALDLWEHTLGLAAMAWGVVLLLDAASASRAGEVRSTRSVAIAAGGAGLCFGVASSMRTEAILYFVTSVAIAGFLGGFPRRWRRPVVLGGAALVAFVAGFLANVLLEVALLGTSMRSGRAAGAAGVGGQGLAQRAREGLTTLWSLAPSLDSSYVLLGLGFALAVGVWALAAAGKVARWMEPVAIFAVIFFVGQRVLDGAGFWPGLFATTPLAAVGAVLGWRHDTRPALLLALIPLPLVFLFQFPGGATPQWGGRYILLSGLLLEVAGVVALVELPRPSQRGLIGLAGVVTLFGLIWTSQRTHAYAAAGDLLAARPEEVLISPDGFPPREFGATWGSKKWLATTPSKVEGAVDIARRSGARDFAIVGLGEREPATYPGYHLVGTSEVPLLNGQRFVVHSYRAD